MSANLIVDIGNTCEYRTSVSVGSGSDLVVGQIVDLQNADTNCQVWVAGGLGGSGVVEVRVQTAEATTSGSFTDPTSGLAANDRPGFFSSGGAFFANSGLHGSGNSFLSSVVNNAPFFCSGGIQFTHFQRPHRYARLILVSGVYPATITAGFLSNKLTTGSGGGFTYAPGSGTVSV